MAGEIDPKKAYKIMQQVGGQGKEERFDAPIYSPPPGRPQYVDTLQKFRYIPDPPNPESMQLEEYEQRHIYQLAMQIAKIFGSEMQPIPDAMYSLVSQSQRASQMFCLVSRTGIKRIDSNRIAWPAIQVVVKEIPVIKIITVLDFAKDDFQVWQIIFWRNDISDYEKPITRGNQSIPPAMVVEFVARYKKVEGIC